MAIGDAQHYKFGGEERFSFHLRPGWHVILAKGLFSEDLVDENPSGSLTLSIESMEGQREELDVSYVNFGKREGNRRAGDEMRGAAVVQAAVKVEGHLVVPEHQMDASRVELWVLRRGTEFGNGSVMTIEVGEITS